MAVERGDNSDGPLSSRTFFNQCCPCGVVAKLAEVSFVGDEAGMVVDKSESTASRNVEVGGEEASGRERFRSEDISGRGGAGEIDDEEDFLRFLIPPAPISHAGISTSPIKPRAT